MNVPRDYLLANQCKKELRVLIHTPLVKSFYSRVSDESDTKRRKWVLLYYKKSIAVVCSKSGIYIRQDDCYTKKKKMWQVKAIAFTKTQQATKLLAYR